jgi:hypothetical protein
MIHSSSPLSALAGLFAKKSNLGIPNYWFLQRVKEDNELEKLFSEGIQFSSILKGQKCVRLAVFIGFCSAGLRIFYPLKTSISFN